MVFKSLVGFHVDDGMCSFHCQVMRQEALLSSVEIDWEHWHWVMCVVMLSLVGEVVGFGGAGGTTGMRGDSTTDCVGVACARGVSVCGL